MSQVILAQGAEAVVPIQAIAKQYAAGPPSDVNMSTSAAQAMSALYIAAQAPLLAERKAEADRKHEDERTKRWFALGITALLLVLVLWLVARPPADKLLKPLAPLIVGAILGYWLKP